MSKETIQYHSDVEQGSDEWREMRRGLLTASEMKNILTPAKLEYAKNKEEKIHVFDLAAQRISGYVEPSFLGFDMIRGKEEEVLARDAYNEHYAPVTECGFITNNKWGFTLGVSVDGLVGDDGLIECKSRKQKYQVETVCNDEMPDEFMMQVQAALLISEREWCDFVSYCGGLPMYVKRIYPEERYQTAIVEAAKTFHARLDAMIKVFESRVADPDRKFLPTERVVEPEMKVGDFS